MPRGLSYARKVHMAQHPASDADRQEQMNPAGAAAATDPLERVTADARAPEADMLEQRMPAGPEPDVVQLPTGSRLPASHIPEADALEQALPADREILEDDE